MKITKAHGTTKTLDHYMPKQSLILYICRLVGFGDNVGSGFPATLNAVENDAYIFKEYGTKQIPGYSERKAEKACERSG